MPNKYYVVTVTGGEYYGTDECSFYLILGAFEDVKTARKNTDDFLNNAYFEYRGDDCLEEIYVFENHKRIKILFRDIEYDAVKCTYKTYRSWEQDLDKEEL